MATEMMPCPECSLAGRSGSVRIGNRRSACRTCNRFSAAVRRGVLARLQSSDPATYEALRAEVERDLYDDLVAHRTTVALHVTHLQR